MQRRSVILVVFFLCVSAPVAMWAVLSRVTAPPSHGPENTRRIGGFDYRTQRPAGNGLLLELVDPTPYAEVGARSLRIACGANEVRVMLPRPGNYSSSRKAVWTDNKIEIPIPPGAGQELTCTIDVLDEHDTMVRRVEHNLAITPYNSALNFMKPQPMSSSFLDALRHTRIDLSWSLGAHIRFADSVCDVAGSCALGLRVVASLDGTSVVVARCYCGNHAYGNLGWNAVVEMTPDVERVMRWPAERVSWTLESDPTIAQRLFTSSCFWEGAVSIPAENVRFR